MELLMHKGMYNKAEYDKKFNKKPSQRKKRAELNRYNRKKGTYGNGDGLDASHIGGKIVGFESEKRIVEDEKKVGRRGSSKNKDYIHERRSISH